MKRRARLGAPFLFTRHVFRVRGKNSLSQVIAPRRWPRASVVRRNLKEAGGKPLSRRRAIPFVRLWMVSLPNEAKPSSCPGARETNDAAAWRETVGAYPIGPRNGENREPQGSGRWHPMDHTPINHGEQVMTPEPISDRDTLNASCLQVLRNKGWPTLTDVYEGKPV